MPNPHPVMGITPLVDMRGEDEEESTLLRALAETAKSYLLSFDWCEAIRELYFGDGIGGIFGVFFAWIQPAKAHVDEFLWIIVGDIPPAYLVTDVSRTPKEAMRSYIAEMRTWVDAAKRGHKSADIIPVNLPPTAQNAEVLEKRLNTLEYEILPRWFAE